MSLDPNIHPIHFGDAINPWNGIGVNHTHDIPDANIVGELHQITVGVLPSALGCVCHMIDQQHVPFVASRDNDFASVGSVSGSAARLRALPPLALVDRSDGGRCRTCCRACRDRRLVSSHALAEIGRVTVDGVAAHRTSRVGGEPGYETAQMTAVGGVTGEGERGARLQVALTDDADRSVDFRVFSLGFVDGC